MTYIPFQEKNMDKFYINGGFKLDGEAEVYSAKNSVLALLAACILTDEQVVIKKCPKIKDVLAMLKILSHLGCAWQFDGNNLIINSKYFR